MGGAGLHRTVTRHNSIIVFMTWERAFQQVTDQIILQVLNEESQSPRSMKHDLVASRPCVWTSYAQLVRGKLGET